MAFREVYGGQDKPLGRRYKFKEDWKRNVSVILVIKPVTGDIRDSMNSKFADRKRDKASGGWNYNIPNSKDSAASKYMAVQCWQDIENGWIVLSDAEAADFYNEELKSNYSIGEEIALDGRMTEAIKADLLEDDLPLANWIVRRATDAEEEVAEVEAEVLQKNSQSSSNSESEITEASPIASVENVR